MIHRYVAAEDRDRRRTRAGQLARVLQAAPECAECGLDLVQLMARVFRAREAYESAGARLRALYGASLPIRLGSPVEIVMLRWERTRDRDHPVNLALERLGFDVPTAALAQLDHRRPLWAGGLDVEGNLQAVCQPCHRAKSAREAEARSRLKRLARRKLGRRP